MATTVKVETKAGNLLATFEALARSILKTGAVEAILAPMRLHGQSMVMPVLVSNREQLPGIDPWAPAFALSAAKAVARLTRRSGEQVVAAVLRPCEIPAFVELVKLNQGNREKVVIIGSDCLGAYTNRDYATFAAKAGDHATADYMAAACADKEGPIESIRLAPACAACEQFTPDGADLAVGLFGEDLSKHVTVTAQTEMGESMLSQLDLSPHQPPAERAPAVAKRMQQHIAQRDQMFAATAALVDSFAGLTAYLANCVNCYNCRVACPVCYCRECVFVTDVFEHNGAQYLNWARRKGAIKMPTDTTFYHLTRLAHMSTACVGCGQCSNACPNDVPVMELFRTVAAHTQAAFDYHPGLDVTQRPPLTTFKETEFEEITGIDDHPHHRGSAP